MKVERGSHCFKIRVEVNDWVNGILLAPYYEALVSSGSELYNLNEEWALLRGLPKRKKALIREIVY